MLFFFGKKMERPLRDLPLACPACALRTNAICREINGVPIRRCSECGHQWWIADSMDLQTLYRDYYSGKDPSIGYDDYMALAKALRQTFTNRIAQLERLIGGTPGSILDIGCGPGIFLEVARSRGWRVQGIDPSESAGTAGKRAFGVNIRTGFFESSLYENQRFNAITLWDTIEHLSDPFAVLRDCRGLLAPNGVVALTTGRADSVAARLSGNHWHLYTLPEHLHFFTGSSLGRCAARAGLNVVASRNEVAWYTISYLVERLVKKSRWGRKLTNAIRRSPLDIPVPATLFDISSFILRSSAPRG